MIDDIDDDKRRCAFEGCWRTREIAGTSDGWDKAMVDGWLYIADWGPGIQRGWYCPEHTKALNELLDSGELDRIQDKAK